MTEGRDRAATMQPIGRTDRLHYPRRAMSDPVGHAGDSLAWVAALRGPDPVQAEALSELHALLLRGARFELGRRRASLTHVPHGGLEDLAMQAAADAMVAILAKLDSFRGESRFTTWAYKFALLEAGVKARRRAWQGREIPLEDDAWSVLADPGPTAHQVLQDSQTLRAIRVAVQATLTEHQRVVFVALALNDVPIDVLAERLDTTRGALYKALHDARRKLRVALADELPATQTTQVPGGEA